MYKRLTSAEERKKRWRRVTLVILGSLFFFIFNWTYEAREIAHTMPMSEKLNIYAWVRQREVSSVQLQLIAEQTGVHEDVIGKLLWEGHWQQVLELQQAYFQPVYTKSENSSLLTVSEYLVDNAGRYVKGTRMVDIQDGDILITKNSRFLGWRNGHAGIVVNAEEGLVLEAIMLGTNTRLCSVKKWEEYPAFMLLRLKEEVSEGMLSEKYRRENVPEKMSDALIERVTLAQFAAGYASEYLVDIPYQLLAGIYDRVFDTKEITVHAAEQAGLTTIPALKGTQCAHLVWYAYKQVGIDLDSDGGLIVTPYDIQNSPYLDVIQLYGY